MREIDALLGLDYDSFEREDISECLDVVNASHDPCEFRYDPESGMIYEDIDITKSKYTYIAKAEEGDIYKVGHTNNLKERASNFIYDTPYSFLNLKPIAFSPRDCEKLILIFTKAHLRILPKPFEKAKEILILTDEDLEYLLDTFGFVRISGEQYPGEITRTLRMYYDPNDGRFVKEEALFKID